LYTFPDDEGHIFNLKFSLSPTTVDQVMISVPATVNARQIINNCLFVWSSASDINGYVFLIAGGEAEIGYGKIIYTHTGNNAGIRVHRIVAVSGDAAVDLFGNVVDVNIDDIDDHHRWRYPHCTERRSHHLEQRWGILWDCESSDHDGDGGARRTPRKLHLPTEP
jgi:hypothetical protein